LKFLIYGNIKEINRALQEFRSEAQKEFERDRKVKLWRKLQERFPYIPLPIISMNIKNKIKYVEFEVKGFGLDKAKGIAKFKMVRMLKGYFKIKNITCNIKVA